MKIIVVYAPKPSDRPEEKKILVWPDSALVRSGKPVFLSDDDLFILPGLCVRIDAVGKSIRPKFAYKYFSETAPMGVILSRSSSDKISAGEDPACNDIVADYSLICGDFTSEIDFPLSVSMQMEDFGTNQKEQLTSEIPQGMIADSIAAASLRNTLKTGDIVGFILPGRMKASRDRLLRMNFENSTTYLIENKLK